MKIALIGYGKMGKEIEKIAVARGHEIVSIIDIDNQQDFESEAFKSADVAIEFTNPHVAYQNYMKTFAAGVKLVSGSTGWLEEHGEEVKKLCTEGGQTLFWSSNFSLGVAVFSAVNKYLASIMNNFPGYEVSMVEIDVRDEWVGKTLIELSLRKKYSVNVVAIRNGDKISTTVDPALPLEKGMQLIVIANTLKLQKLK